MSGFIGSLIKYPLLGELSPAQCCIKVLHTSQLQGTGLKECSCSPCTTCDPAQVKRTKENGNPFRKLPGKELCEGKESRKQLGIHANDNTFMQLGYWEKGAWP